MKARRVYTELEATAFHEAGHAMVAFLKRVRIVQISILPDVESGSLGHLLSSGKLGAAVDQGLSGS